MKPKHDAHPQSQWVVQCDFDGTISLSDVTDTLLERFGSFGWEQLEQDWRDGKIGSRECMSKQIALLDMTSQELNDHLRCIKIDPQFPAFVDAITALGWSIEIVSDGLDWAIREILALHHLGHLPIFANHLIYGYKQQWLLNTPWSCDQCIQKSANCKCQLLAKKQQRKQRVLYIGDGNSDFCVSGKADLVLAKSSLITYCKQNNIPHLNINNFEDAIKLLPTIVNCTKDRMYEYA